VLPFAAFRATAFFSGGVSAGQFLEAIHSSSKYRARDFTGATRDIIDRCKGPSGWRFSRPGGLELPGR
jgi:hypothetical protein